MRCLLPFLMLKGRSNRARGEFLVFAFGLTEYRDIRVSIFPGDEEIVVGFQALLTLPLLTTARDSVWEPCVARLPGVK